DGTRIVSTYCELGSGASNERAAHIWDTVPHRYRLSERQALEAASLPAEDALAEALSSTGSWILAGKRLRDEASLDQNVRHAAINLLTQRSNSSVEKLEAFIRRAKAPTRYGLVRYWDETQDQAFRDAAACGPLAFQDCLSGIGNAIVSWHR